MFCNKFQDQSSFCCSLELVVKQFHYHFQVLRIKMKQELRDQFNRDGFYVIEGFLSEAETDALKREGENLVKNMPEQSKRAVLTMTDYRQSKDQYFLESADKMSYFFESDALGPKGELLVEPHLSLNKIAHGLHLHNDVFKKITVDQRVKDVCFELGLVDPGVLQGMLIFKNPRIGGVVTPHQDSTYLYTEPVNVVGFWIALEDATLENGCLWFLRGSHKTGLHRRYMRNPDKSSNELVIFDRPNRDYKLTDFTPCPVKKGSCVLLHGQVVHYSEPNKSDKSRHAYTFHVMEQHNTKWAEDNWLQPTDGSFLSVYKN